MRWLRAKTPLNLTKNNLDPFSYFFNKQQEEENSNVDQTPLTDEGIQNVGDAAINSNSSAPSIKVSYEKIPYEFFSKIMADENYLGWLNDSQVPDKYILKKYLKDKRDVPVLIFEDFNTTGIKGDWNEHEPTLKNGKRNDYNIFFWYTGNPVGKGENKAGGIGVGRLTFAFSSKINTFFTFSVREDKSKFFIGMSCLGKSKKTPSYDQMARYGIPERAKDGSEIVKPITDEGVLKKIHKELKLKKSFDEPGTAMIVVLPTDSLKADNMTLNSITRYRYAFHKKNIGGMEILKYQINKDKMLNTIKQLRPSEHKRYSEYLKFIDECDENDKSSHFRLVEIQKGENPSRIKKENFKEEQLTEIAKDYNSGKVVSLKVPLSLVKLEDDDERNEKVPVNINTFFKVFIKKTEFGMGMDDVMRGTMPVCDFRSLENQDAFGLVLIDDAPAKEFFKMAETPNHRIFEKTKDLVNSYEKYQNQILLLKSSIPTLKSIIEDRENVITVAPTQGIFSWTGGDDEGQRKRGPGVDTKKEVSKWIFENPKTYKIEKLNSDKMTGLKVSSTNFKEECLNRIEKIKDILENPKYNKSKKKIKELEVQSEKLKNWSKGKNLEQLFPAKIRITCAQDIEGQSYEKNLDLHDKNLDFDFTNKINNNIQEEKEGDITSVEFESNEINIYIGGGKFTYKFLFDASINKATGEGYDLIFDSQISRRNL